MKSLRNRYTSLILVAALAVASFALPVSAVTYSSYFANKLVDQIFRAQAYTFPTTALSVGLLVSTHGTRSNGASYTTNNTVSVTATDGLVHLYKNSVASCTSNGSSPTFTGANGEVVTDNTCSWTEQAAAVRAGTVTEASWTNYARANLAASLTNWAGTQSAGSTTASSGTGQPLTSNNATLTFGTTVGSGPSFVWGFAFYDATSGGNLLMVVPLSTVKTISNGDGAPTFAAGQAQIFIDR